jgi:WD40 repeat protein
LIKHRLLTAAWDAASGEETIEVVHEALIRGWPRLSGWINEDRDFNRFRQKLTLDATEWDARGRNDTEVYRGGPLEEATGYLHSRKDDLTQLEQDFIRAGEAHHEAEIQKEKKRFTFLRRLFIVAAIGFVGAGIAAYVANNLRKISYSKEIGLRVLAMPDEDPRMLLQMAIDAFETKPTMEAQEALRLAVQQANAKQVIRGFGSDLRFASFSPDGDVLATTSLDSSIKLWNASNGTLTATIKAPFSNNTWFSPLGTYLWSYTDSTIVLWNASDGQKSRSLNASAPIAMASWSSDESKVIVACLDSTARILDVRTGRELARIHDDTGRVLNAYFNKDGTRLVIQSMGKSLFRSAPYDVRLFDAHTLNPLAHLRSNSRRLTSMAHFSKDGQHVLTYFVGSGLQGIEHPEEIPLMEIWDARTGALEYKLQSVADWEVYCSGQFSSNGKYLLATRNLNAVLYDGKTGKEIRWFRGHTGQIIQATFFDSARYIMTFGDDKTTRLWETETGKLVTTLHGHRSTAVGASVAQDGSALITYGGDSTVWLYRKNPLEDFNYNAELFAARFTTSRYEEGESVISNAGIVTLFPYAGTVVRSFDVQSGKLRDEHQLASPLGQLDYNPLIGRAAYCLDDGTINTLDVEKHQWAPFGKTEPQYNQFSSLSRNGQYALVGTLTYSWALFDREKKVTQLSNSDKPSRFAAMRPDGKEALIYYNDSGAMTRVELPSGRVLNRWTKDHQRAPWYEPTGRRFITSTQELTTICDAATGDIIGTIPGKYTSSFDISADGKLMVLACRDKTVQIVDLEKGKLIKTISGAENEVNVVAISPDGSKVIACEKNGTCEVWETKSLDRIAILRGYKGTVQNAIFSRNGKFISTRGTKQDGSCRVYYTNTEDVLTLAKSKLAAMK